MATVLIVDDQRETGHLLARILQFLGHKGVYVESGEDALALARQSPPDAILLDYMMPDMDGLQVLKQLRNDPRTQRLPVIMFTANGDPKVQECAMKSGATDFWLKAGMPIEEMELRLSKWLYPN